MVWVPGQDRQSAINLLGHEDAHDLVGQRELAEGDKEVGATPDRLVQSVRAADDKGDRRTTIPPGPEALGEIRTGQRSRAFVERDELRPLGAGQEQSRFRGDPLGCRTGTGFRYLDNLDGSEAGASADAVSTEAVAIDEVALGPVFQPTDREKLPPHESTG